MLNVFSVFLGGGIGSVLRHLITARIASHWGVMLVNICGALVIGLAYEFFLSRSGWRPELKAFVITGLLGGFTTFSTYILDFNNLMASQKIWEAWGYLLGSLLVGFCFLAVGAKVGKFLW